MLTKKRAVNVLIILIYFMLFLLFLLLDLEVGCIFKKIFKIACPACGLTRSIKSILNFDFASAINYNILGIPMFLFFVVSFFLLIRDIIKNDDKFLKSIINMLGRYYKLIFLILILVMVINNIHGI